MSTSPHRVTADTLDNQWWVGAVIYQIYPRSFQDSNADGVGDIPGIIDRLDYLEDLGVDAIWLGPVYETPDADFGYDIANYRAIDPQFGTMADWETLRDDLHERDMRLIMDLVLNHTSDEHEWFQSSRADPKSPYGDFYIWRPGRNGGPPNNWESVFGGSAWTYDEAREEYYLHLFDQKQPDLDWSNPAVRQALYDIVDFWLEQAVDGFRLDVINFISKTSGLPDGDPYNTSVVGSEHFINGPAVGEYLQELCNEAIGDKDILIVGETPGLTVEDAKSFVGPGRLDMAFHFEHVSLDAGDPEDWTYGEWTLDELRETYTRWQTGMYPDGWNALYLGNHDQPRPVSRFGDDERFWYESATMLATLQLTLRGTPFAYQGEELGMTNTNFESPAEVADVEARRYIERQLAAGKTFDDIRHEVEFRSRDNARTPMQWSDELNAGFTDPTVEPWFPINPNYTEINVEKQSSDPSSVLSVYRRLIELRKAHHVLVVGRFVPMLEDHADVFAYKRLMEAATATVLLNFSGMEVSVPSIEGEGESLVFTNYTTSAAKKDDRLLLRPYEAHVYIAV